MLIYFKLLLLLLSLLLLLLLLSIIKMSYIINIPLLLIIKRVARPFNSHTTPAYLAVSSLLPILSSNSLHTTPSCHIFHAVLVNDKFESASNFE